MNKTKFSLYTSKMLFLTVFYAIMIFAAPRIVNAQTFEPVSVNKVEDITSDFSGIGYSVKNNLDFSTKTGEFTDVFYYQFTLEAPGYVLLKEYADLWEYNFNGDIKYYISNSTVFADNPVINKFADGRDGSYASLYEAGTYYIKVELIFESDNKEYLKKSPYYNFSVFTQPATRSGMTDGNSWASAVALSNGKPVNGIISKQNRKQYFSFSQGSNGNFSTDVVASVPVGWELPELSVKLYNNAGAEVTSAYINQIANSAVLSVKNLAKGNYYIMVSTTEKVADKKGVCTISANASCKTVKKLAAPKLKSYKAGSKKITGTAVKGAKVTVKIGKKSYTATAKKGKFIIKLKSKLKKGTVIKVKATKSGYSASKIVTYKVKKK